MVLSKKGDYKQAFQNFKKAIEVNKNNPEAYNNIGYYYSTQDDVKYIENYNKSIELNPKYFEAYLNFGNFMLNNGDTKGAISKLNKAIEINENNPNIFNDIGIAYEKNGQIRRINSKF